VPEEGVKEGKGDLPVACTLSGPELGVRREELGEILAGRLKAEELEDGYEFLFPGDGGWAARLAEFVLFERACCPFFAFELGFEPGGGPIRLRVRGPEGAKSIVAEMVAISAG
jgi:hypothetical protein